MKETKPSKNWKIRYLNPNDPDSMFFVEADKLEEEYGYNIEMLGEDATYPDEVRLADAKLIVEAGNVHDETGKTPRQLLEEHKKLTEALGKILELNDQAYRNDVVILDDVLSKIKLTATLALNEES